MTDLEDEDNYNYSDVNFTETDFMYMAIGYFIAQYSLVELAITALLAIVSDAKDLEAFHVLTRGMDAKVKVERLRELCRTKDLIPKGSSMDVRLSHFTDKVANLRNKVAHSMLVMPSDDPPRVLFSNIAKLPFDVFGMKRRHKDKPDEITISALQDHSGWLDDFQEDILSVLPLAKSGSALEIKNLHSMAPTEFLAHLQQQDFVARENSKRQKPPKKEK